MAKRKVINELTNLLAIALRHKIGSIVNKNEVYSQKYALDAEVLINSAKKVSLQEHWNNSDKEIIKKELKKKLYNELKSKEFIEERKFEIMDDEIIKVLIEFGLN